MQNVMSEQSNECFLTARQTRARYGNVSDMWLHRRLHAIQADSHIRLSSAAGAAYALIVLLMSSRTARS
jgi:hypothetical protein